MYNIIQKRKIFYVISLIVIIPGILAWIVFGLKLGIDFTGGSVSEYSINSAIDTTTVKKIYQQKNIQDITINTLDDNRIRVTSSELTLEQHQEVIDEMATVASAKELSFSSIGPTVGTELKQKAVTATILVFVFIILYITWTFRKSATGPIRSWVFGFSAFLALVHDLLIVVGVFAILGHYLNVRIDTLFVTSLLTVLGFSVHDTIVVFDRIRERLKSQTSSETFESVINTSISQTLVRSLATSLTIILVLVALLLFGGQTIMYFVIALLIGMIVGTYSSICIASPFLVTWYSYKIKKGY